MANIAIIIAGGSGHRMGQDIPKQFINVYDKPILIYTLEESIRNGVYSLEGKANPDDTVIIHDGIRPLVEPSVLTDVISKCKHRCTRGTNKIKKKR